jgi:hypothetical protein
VYHATKYMGLPSILLHDPTLQCLILRLSGYKKKSKISIVKPSIFTDPIKKNSNQEKSIKVKKILPKSRKPSQDQEKDVMIKKNSSKTKRILQRYNPKDSGNYQKQIPLPYGKQKKQDGRQRSDITRYHENITIRYPEK